MSPPLNVRFPWTLLRNWEELQDGTLHLPCWTDIHTPAHISSIGYRVSEIPSSQILSFLPCFQVLALGGRNPRSSGPRPYASSDFEIGDPYFKADYCYSLRKPWEWGCLFSQTVLLNLCQPCLTDLFVPNGKFSAPALKIYSSRMPSLKPKSLGLPRGDKTKKTYLLF